MKLTVLLVSLVVCVGEGSVKWYKNFIPKDTNEKLYDIKQQEIEFFDKDVYINLNEIINKNYMDINGNRVDSKSFFYQSLCGFIDAIDKYNSLTNKMDYFNMNEETFKSFTKTFEKVLVDIYKNTYINPKIQRISDSIRDFDIHSLNTLRDNDKKFIDFCTMYFMHCLFNGKKHFAKSGVFKKFYDLNQNNIKFTTFSND